MSISLKLTTESHFEGTDTYFLHEVRPADGPRVLRVEYEGDYLMYPGNGPLPPTPTSWEISGAAADEFETKLASLSVRVCPEFAMGLDGTTTTLSIEHGFNRLTLCWWAKLPDAWRDVRELLAYLRASQPGLMTGEEE